MNNIIVDICWDDFDEDLYKATVTERNNRYYFKAEKQEFGFDDLSRYINKNEISGIVYLTIMEFLSAVSERVENNVKLDEDVYKVWPHIELGNEYGMNRANITTEQDKDLSMVTISYYPSLTQLKNDLLIIQYFFDTLLKHSFDKSELITFHDYVFIPRSFEHRKAGRGYYVTKKENLSGKSKFHKGGL